MFKRLFEKATFTSKSTYRKKLKLIRNYKANKKITGLVILWVKLRRAGYTRIITSFYHQLIKLGIYEKTPSKRKEKNVGY